MSKHKTCLGWYINTHSLRVFLSKEKQTARATNIKEALASKQNRYTGINDWKYQSIRTCHPTFTIILTPATTLTEYR